MKTLFIIILGFTILYSQKGEAQTVKFKDANAIYLSFQPGDFGWGVRYDRRISKLGVYSSLSLGNYELSNQTCVKNHIKMALGGIFYFRKKYGNKSNNSFNFGLSYHVYGEKLYIPGTINEQAFKPLSCEVGWCVRVEHFIGGIRFDPLKWEGVLDFGISF